MKNKGIIYNLKLIAALLLAPVFISFSSGLETGTPGKKDQLKVYIAPGGAPLSEEVYKVRVRQNNGNWLSLPVYSFMKQYSYLECLTAIPNFVYFDSEGEVEVEVEVMVEFQQLKIYPQNLKIATRQEGNKVFLFMNDKVRLLSFEIDGEAKKPLLLFSNTVEDENPGSDKITDSTLYFGPGYHSIPGDGIIRAKSIYIAGGAIVEGHICIENKSGCKISGRGILYNPLKDEWGSRIICIKKCSNVQLSGIICIQRSTGWGINPIASHDVSISGIKLIAEVRDGIDILNCQRVSINNSFVMAHDDVICLKGIKEGENEPVEDIKVEHCVLSNMGGGNGMEIGYESVTPVYQRILFNDIDLIHCLTKFRPHPDWPEAAISIHPTRMGEYEDSVYMRVMPPVRDVTYKDIRITSAEDILFVDIFPNRNSPGKGISNILFKNVNIYDGPRRPSRVLGNPDHPIHDITFDNLKILGKEIKDPASGMFVTDCKTNITFR
jgi:hypothetical protein